MDKNIEEYNKFILDINEKMKEIDMSNIGINYPILTAEDNFLYYFRRLKIYIQEYEENISVTEFIYLMRTINIYYKSCIDIITHQYNDIAKYMAWYENMKNNYNRINYDQKIVPVEILKILSSNFTTNLTKDTTNIIDMINIIRNKSYKYSYGIDVSSMDDSCKIVRDLIKDLIKHFLDNEESV